MFPVQAGEGFPFAGRLVTVSNTEKGLFIPVPFDMLRDAGITEGSQVEVWGLIDGTVSMRIATKCQFCGRGARLYDLDMGPVKRQICAEDYYKLTGGYPQELEKPTTENTTQTEQP